MIHDLSEQQITQLTSEGYNIVDFSAIIFYGSGSSVLTRAMAIDCDSNELADEYKRFGEELIETIENSTTDDVDISIFKPYLADTGDLLCVAGKYVAYDGDITGFYNLQWSKIEYDLQK